MKLYLAKESWLLSSVLVIDINIVIFRVCSTKVKENPTKAVCLKVFVISKSWYSQCQFITGECVKAGFQKYAHLLAVVSGVYKIHGV
jgi:hypothetical protein